MSRSKKFRLNWYQANDSEAMAAKLEKMAAKGWLLEKVSNLGWTYRRAEPAQVKYTITYFPDASIFDATPTEGQETYADFCRAAGWELVAAYGPIQYFRSTRPDPVPIETDEGEKLRASHKAMLKTLVLSHALLLFAFGIQIPSDLQDFQHAPLSTVSSSLSLAQVLLTVFLVLYLAAVLADYFIWYLRSKRSVERGGACAKVHTRARIWGGYALLAACALVLWAAVSEISSPGMALIWLYASGGMVLLMALSRGVMAFLKSCGYSRATVRGGFVAAGILLAIVYTAGIVPLANWLLRSGLMEEREPAYVYTGYSGQWDTYQGEAVYTSGYHTWDIYQDDLPLTLEDLGFAVTEEDHCSYEAEESRSVLASYTTFSQQAMGTGSDLPELRFQIAEIPWAWLRTQCVSRLVEGYSVSLRGISFRLGEHRAVEDDRWGADEVYLSLDTNSFLLVYGQRIASVDAGWDLTDEQIAVIARKLGK